jgi:hypothetical protein
MCFEGAEASFQGTQHVLCHIRVVTSLNGLPNEYALPHDVRFALRDVAVGLG